MTTALTLGFSMPEISLLLFLGMFLGLLAWLFLFRRKGWDREASLPLDAARDEQGTKEPQTTKGRDRHV